ncbi:hypothetical protein N9V49_03215 [Flavobacteriaceae bacterium]|nr:hypothetical protein [Flavobacteriaceae bacterium]
MLKKEQLKHRIEPHIYKDLKFEEYDMFAEKSTKLLSTNRLDLGFKLYFLEYINRNDIIARDVYFKSLKANKLFTIKEYGNKKKNSLKDFEFFFKELFDKIKIKGFDINKSILPLNINNELLNGSHRLAISSFLSKEISYIKTEHKDFEKQDYNYFYKRNVEKNYIEKAVQSFSKFSDDIYIAFIWPRANINYDIIKSKFDNILYYKEIQLSFSGGHYLISEVYSGDFWTGDYKDKFKGSLGKVKECFNNTNPLKVLYFKEVDKKKVLKIKQEIRNICNAGKHSIHITDHKYEVNKISKILLNENSIEFLNKANIFRFKENFKIISDFKSFLKNNNIDTANIVVDSSFVMSLYGIRKAKDLDYISISNVKNPLNNFFNQVKSNDLNYHVDNVKDLIFDSKNFFYFQGIKFLTLKKIYQKKKKRAEKKDLTDVKLIESYLEGNNLKLILNNLRQKKYYIAVILKVYSIKVLKTLRIHKFVKSIFSFFTKKND